jgi:hypothetical protein
MAVDRRQFEWYRVAPRRLGLRYLFYNFVSLTFCLVRTHHERNLLGLPEMVDLGSKV